MRVLIACEFSGIVRDAFLKKGHDAWSCDLLETESRQANHLKGDIKAAIKGQLYNFDAIDIYGKKPVYKTWDLMIAHPPCTYLSVSGARWFKDRQKEQKEAIEFFMELVNVSIGKIAIENPKSIMSTKYRKPDQIIHPWQFGHKENKLTCLWLKGLPNLRPTDIVFGRKNKIHEMSPSKDRGRLRSITYQGIADAMAEQWGSLRIY